MPGTDTKNSTEPEDLSDETGQPRFPWGAIGFTLVAVLATIVFAAMRGTGGLAIELAFILSACTLISIVIWQACDPFADAAQWVGIRLRIPSSVRGATLDAIASSMPELFTGIFFVTVALTSSKSALERLQASAEGYGSTIATCAGSSIYNMILIPAICAIAIGIYRKKKPVIEISTDVLRRDGSWVLATQAGLLIFLFQPELSWWMGVIAIAAYAAYVLHLFLATRSYRKTEAGSIDVAREQMEAEQSEAEMLFGIFSLRLNGLTASLVLAATTLIAAGACYLLVELTRTSAERLEVPAFFVAVILTAAVSSIPDTFVSLGSAKRGDDSGAMSNVFGSNIFDICIGMSIPLLVSCYLNDWEPITLIDDQDQTMRGVVGLRVFLFVLTVIAMAIMWARRRISSRTGWFFTVLYASFVLYAILGALDILPA